MRLCSTAKRNAETRDNYRVCFSIKNWSLWMKELGDKKSGGDIRPAVQTQISRMILFRLMLVGALRPLPH